MFQAVLFDLDGTLYDRDAAILRFAADQHRRLSLGAGGLDADTYARRFAELDARGHVWKDRVYEILAPELATHFSATALLDDYHERFRDQCLPFEGVREALIELQAGGARFGLVTNGLTEFQLRTFHALGLSHFFEQVAVSEQAGVRKPDRRIFQMVLDGLGVAPTDAAFVGDDPVADIGGAKATGMAAVWVESVYHLAPTDADATVGAIRDLPTVLRRLSARSQIDG